DGLGATVVTLALAADIDAIAARSDLIPKDWASRLPHNAAPYASTIVFLVRRGNPKGVRDWGDLTREGVEVITPNPKTSGGARWNVLAAWTWAMRAHGGDETVAKAWLGALFAHVPVLDTGARGATTTFARRGVGDVLLAWENEAMLALDEMPEEGFEIVVPSVSILAEPPVALVEGNIRSQAQLQAARDYLEGLYRPEAQALALRRHFRARDLSAADAELTARFPTLELATIADYGGWSAAQARFFADGGIFDQVWGR
ncbi:MAG: sulfate ABC transporter substrate-binding protein, partial [Pseudomonadota bacterium]|nr:sulfate ABC transporter substrate-binding protein [Pseudomonadota bacterium]